MLIVFNLLFFRAMDYETEAHGQIQVRNTEHGQYFCTIKATISLVYSEIILG